MPSSLCPDKVVSIIIHFIWNTSFHTLSPKYHIILLTPVLIAASSIYINITTAQSLVCDTFAVVAITKKNDLTLMFQPVTFLPKHEPKLNTGF
jgi:hypothetical protein